MSKFTDIKIALDISTYMFYTKDNTKTDNMEVATRCALFKKVFLEISQNSQENTCVRACFLIKLQACVKFLRTPFLQNTSGRLLLAVESLTFVEGFIHEFTEAVTQVFCKKGVFKCSNFPRTPFL